MPGALSYRLWRREGARAAFELLATVEDVQFFDSPPERGVSRAYRVQAVGAEGDGPFSEDRTFLLPALPAPRQADATRWHRTRVVAFEQREGPPRMEVHLKWRSVRGAVGYRVLRRDAGAGAFEVLGFLKVPFAKDDTVEDGRDYEYAVVSLGEDLAESARSVVREIKVSSATPNIRVPAPPPPAAAVAVRVWEVTNAAPGGAAARTAPLAEPFDLAYDAARDRLYVTSPTERRVVVLRGEDGRQVTAIGPAVGAARLEKPLGVGVDRKGNLLVADAGQAAVLVVSPEGELVRRIALSAKGLPRAPRPVDVAVHDDGRIFVSDAANRQVVVLSSKGWEAARWGSPKRGEPLLSVGAIEISAEGRVVVADGAAGKVRVFATSGRPEATFGERGPGENQFLFLGGHTSLGDGSILASDVWSAAITAFGASSGPIVLARGADGREPGGPPLLGPVNLAGDRRDRVFVAEGVANRVTCLRIVAPGGPAKRGKR